MSLTKNSFEEAKKKASKRISDWVDEAKTAGIVRLQDRYRQTFKSIEWKNKPEKTKIIHTRKPTNEKTSNNRNEGKDEKEKQKDSYVKGGKNNSTERKEAEIKERSRTQESRTPVSERNTESRAERNTGSRADRNAESRADRNTDSRASRASRTSRKIFRDSANILYGDNRNNRSSLFSSRDRCSRSSIDAISLLFDGDSEGIENEQQKEELITSFKAKTVIKNGKNKPLSKLPTILQQPDYAEKTRRAFGKNGRDLSTDATTLLGKQILRKRKGKKKRKDFIADVIVDPCDMPKIQVDIGSGTFILPPNSVLDRPSDSSSLSISDMKIRIPSRTTMGNNLSRPISQILPRVPSTMVSCASSQLLTRAPSQPQQRTHQLMPVKSFLKRIKSARSRVGQTRSKRTLNEQSTIQVYEDPEARKEFVRKKFRKLVRKLINIKTLLKDSQIKIRKEMGELQFEKKEEKTGLRISFDPTQFKAASNTYGGITKRARQALWKQPTQRTEDDIGVLMEVMYRLPFFAKFSLKVKRELAKIIWYDQFERSRIIIKQDDPGSRMYFIISGTVSFHMTETDPRSGIKNIRHLRDVCSGAVFGELALIRNITRTYTAICKDDICEFLSLSKEEFNVVLRKRWEEDWQARVNFMKTSKHFKDWSEENVINCADHSELREYSDNKVIFGDETSLTNEVFFIRKGKAIMAKKILLVRNKSPYLRPALFLPGMKGADTKTFMDKSYGKQMRSSRKEKHFVTVMTLLQDSYFGVGEDLKDTYIISKGKTECVVINSATYNINNKTDALKELSSTRQAELPSNRELYHRFETNRRWMEYRKSLVKEIVQHKNIPNTTTKADIPVSFMLEPQIPDDLLL